MWLCGNDITMRRSGDLMPDVDADHQHETTLADAGLLAAVRQFHDCALSWHDVERIAVPAGDGVEAKALLLHAFNFDLWHHEDAVRRVGAGDHEIARRKRCIDDLNGRRCATIEDIDITLLEVLHPNPRSPLHTDTPATIVDRLSVLALRISHANRANDHQSRVALLQEQYDDLVGGLEEFLADLRAGTANFKVYRQFKSAGQRSYCGLFAARHT